MPARPLGALATTTGVVWWALSGSAAQAEAARISVDIDCPALGDDGRAAFEARVRVDLAATHAQGGRLALSCDGQSAQIRWRPVDGDIREEKALLVEDRASAVDQVLDIVHTLFADRGATEPQAPPVSSETTAPPSPLEEVPAPASPVAAESENLPWWLAIAGARSELWSGGIGAAFGADGGMGVALRNEWRITLVASPTWGMSSAKEIHAFSLRTAAIVDRVIFRHLDVGLGAGARGLWSSGPAQSLLPSGLSGVTAGAVLYAGYRTAVGPLDISIGPQLEALLRPIIVRLDGQEVFRLPTFVAALSLDASTRTRSYTGE